MSSGSSRVFEAVITEFVYGGLGGALLDYALATRAETVDESNIVSQTGLLVAQLMANAMATRYVYQQQYHQGRAITIADIKDGGGIVYYSVLGASQPNLMTRAARVTQFFHGKLDTFIESIRVEPEDDDDDVQ